MGGRISSNNADERISGIALYLGSVYSCEKLGMHLGYRDWIRRVRLKPDLRCDDGIL